MLLLLYGMILLGAAAVSFLAVVDRKVNSLVIRACTMALLLVAFYFPMEGLQTMFEAQIGLPGILALVPILVVLLPFFLTTAQMALAPWVTFRIPVISAWIPQEGPTQAPARLLIPKSLLFAEPSKRELWSQLTNRLSMLSLDDIAVHVVPVLQGERDEEERCVVAMRLAATMGITIQRPALAAFLLNQIARSIRDPELRRKLVAAGSRWEAQSQPIDPNRPVAQPPQID